MLSLNRLEEIETRFKFFGEVPKNDEILALIEMCLESFKLDNQRGWNMESLRSRIPENHEMGQ